MRDIIKKKGGMINDLIMGIGSLIIGVIVILVIVATVLNANLLGAGVYNNTAQGMAGNFTTGIDNVSGKIPTILLIAAVVLLLGVLVFLVVKAKQMGMGSGGGGTL
jgi:hypothetical protein